MHSFQSAALCRTRLPGFTLVELMVVIAIVAVLISLLMPALRKSRDVSRDFKCLTNVKQNGAGAHMYSMDWKDYYMSQIWSDKDASDPGGPIHLGAGAKRPGNYWAAQDGLTQFGYASTKSSLWRCPRLRTSEITKWTFGKIVYTYSVTALHGGYVPASEHRNKRAGPYRGAEIKYPTRTWLLFDSPILLSNPSADPVYSAMAHTFSGHDRAPGNQQLWAKSTTKGVLTHDKSINVVFWDGHAASPTWPSSQAARSRVLSVNYNDPY